MNGSHPFHSIAKVDRVEVGGEITEVRLLLMRESDIASLEGGEHFVTLKMAVDPEQFWE